MLTEKKLLLGYHYFMVYIVIGSTYFFNKQAVAHISPMYVVAFRYLVGGIILLSIARLQGDSIFKASRPELLSSLFIGVFLFVIGAGFVTIGQQFTYSYLTSLITSSVPLLVVCYDFLLFKRRPKLLNVLGVLIGIAGVAVLMYDGSPTKTEFNVGFVFILVGAASWSFATSIAHKMPVHKNPLITSGMRMFFAGIICLIVGLVLYGSPIEAFANATPVSLWSTLYLGVVGSMAFNSYSYLIQHQPAQKVSTYALVNPIFAMIFGIIFAKEEAVPYLWLGMLMTLVGLLIHFYGESIVGAIRKACAAKMRKR